EPLDVELRSDHPRLYKPPRVNPDFATDTSDGDLGAGLADADAVVDEVYETPHLHNNPMEPHATTAVWNADGSLVLYESTQGGSPSADTIGRAFGLDPAQVRVIAPHVGGGFGSK